MLRFTLLTAIGLSLIGGCFADPNTSNLLSAGAKLMSNPADPPIGDLTAAEIVAISASLPQLAAQFPQLGIPVDAASFPVLTQQQAADAAAFLKQYGITTVSQLQQLIIDASEGRIQVEIPQSLLDLAASLGFETDAAKLAPAQ